jgi:hypothetical protein
LGGKGLNNPEDEGAAISRMVGNYFSVHLAYNTKTLETSDKLFTFLAKQIER